MLTTLLYIVAVSPVQILRASTIAALLSADQSKPITIGSELGEAMVYLDPNGANRWDRVTALATALNASVVERADGFVIERTKADRARISNHRTQQRLSWIQHSMQDIAEFRRRSLAGQSVAEAFWKDVDRQYEQRNEMRLGKLSSGAAPKVTSIQLLPAGQFANQILDRIGLKNIASVPTGEIQVFQDVPAFGCSQLPAHQDLDEVFDREQSALNLSDATPARRAKFVGLGLDRLVAFGPTSMESLSKTRVRLVASVSSITSTVEGFSIDGSRLFRVNATYSPTGRLLSSSSILRQIPTPKSSSFAALSHDSIDALEFWRTRGGAIPTWVTRPDITEPLNLFVRDALEGIQRQFHTRKCFAAAVSDRLWKHAIECAQGTQINLEGLKAILDSWLPYETIEDDASCVIRPLDPEDADRTRVSRKLLATFAKQMIRRSDPLHVADLFMRAGASGSVLGTAWVLLVQSPRERPVGLDASREFYSLIGSIADSDWDLLLNRERATIGQLGLRAPLDSYLLHDSTIKVITPQPLSDWMQFPIECLPTGESDTSEIEVVSKSIRVAKNYRLGQPIPNGWDPFSGVGTYLCPRSAVMRNEDGSLMLTLNREKAESTMANEVFWLGSRIDYEITIALLPGFVIKQNISGGVIPDKEPFRYVDLSGSERDQAWVDGQKQALEWAKANPPVDVLELKRRLAGSGGNPPPRPN